MSADSLSLEKILDLEQLEVWTYRGFSWRQESIRVFGGQVAGQALAAAGRTVETGRRVLAVQHGEVIFSLSASFAAPAGGLSTGSARSGTSTRSRPGIMRPRS
jgi:acyl-CoA thioesterase